MPGFTFSSFSYTMSIFHPRIIRDLALRRFGFEVLSATDLFLPIAAFTQGMSMAMRRCFAAPKTTYLS